ncbi:MAG TPA: hypothetical protein VIM85_08180 [Pseudomonadales bacterium]
MAINTGLPVRFCAGAGILSILPENGYLAPVLVLVLAVPVYNFGLESI